MASKDAWLLNFDRMGRHQGFHRSTNPALSRQANNSSGRPVLVMGLFSLFVAFNVVVAGAVSASGLKKDTLVLVAGGKRHTIEIEVAETSQQKAMGLMFRQSLARRAGMLFPYASPQELTMWMRNTYIPLDMVFIAKGGLVHRIEENTEPFSERIIASKGKVIAVLELAGGVARELGLKAGDKIESDALAN